MSSLFSYLKQVQRLIRDSKQIMIDPGDLIDYVNQSGQTATLAPGTGVTLSGQGVAAGNLTVPANTCARILVSLTSQTAVTMQSLYRFTVS